MLIAATVLFSGCRKKPDPLITPPIDTSGVAADGHLKIVLENMAGTQVLVLNTGSYINAAGDTFTVSRYKYYITNIKLWRADSTFFAQPESYHFINEEMSTSKSFLIHEVPVGQYVSMTFLIGVDYDRNTSGAQTGALDVNNAMFWDWNTGYIMAKVEGTANGIGPMAFHIGGFDGANGVIRSRKLLFPVAANVTGTTTPEVHIKSDLLEWFKTPTTIDFSNLSLVMTAGFNAKTIADNYSDMFTVDHVQN